MKPTKRAKTAVRVKPFIICKLQQIAILSSILASIAVFAQAHEVQPAIADFEVTDGQAHLTIDLNIEAYLSGIDLDGLEDTDDAARSDAYDILRQMPPEALGAQLPGLIARWNDLPLISVDGADVEMVLQKADIGDIGNPEQVRASSVQLSGPIDGRQVILNWPSGAGDLVLRQQGVPDPFTGYLSGGQSSPPISISGGSAQSGWGAFAAFIPVGFDHILPKGLDHILFVIGLFFFSTALRPLLWQVTAFTAAHTVTLALGSLGIVNIPGSIVEPLIALSIVYVAVENLFVRDMGAWRPAIVFGFGLLHGLGFASVLGDYGLPDAQFVPALLGFNLGVEIGQLTVISACAILLWVSVKAAQKAQMPAYEAAVEDYGVMFRAVSIPGSLVIAVIGIWWVIERTLL